MSQLVSIPLIIPLLTGALALIGWRSVAWQRIVSTTGAFALLAASIALFVSVTHSDNGIIVLQAGAWPAPFGISLVADRLAAMMVLLTGIVAAVVVIYALMQVPLRDEMHGFHPLFHFLLMGVAGAFLTGDLFNLFVWFEVMLLSSFVLLAINGRRMQMEGAVKYVAINLLASTLFLTGLGILYGKVGTLNMADVARLLADNQESIGPSISVVSALFIVSFGIKAGLFPLFFWLPAAYHTPSVPVSALFAGLLTKVGVYALIRVFTLIFHHDDVFTHEVLMVLGVATLLVGGLGPIAQMEIRKVLSFHIISQIGYMIIGLALGTSLAIASALFFIGHNIIVKTNLFLIGGIVARLGGTEDLKALGGHARAHPFMAGMFLISALALAGLPPLSGFFAKLGIVQAGISAAHIVATAACILGGFLTLYSMLKLWNEIFWKPDPKLAFVPVPRGSTRHWRPVPAGATRSWRAGQDGVAYSWYGPSIAFTLMILAIGVFAGPIFAFCESIGAELLDPSPPYIDAVLGARATAGGAP
jgi:multicomponent Na+:H+ antiporter subunit D